jgi:hypothetical protein
VAAASDASDGPISPSAVARRARRTLAGLAGSLPQGLVCSEKARVTRTRCAGQIRTLRRINLVAAKFVTRLNAALLLGAAMPINSFIQPGAAFEPEVIAAMSEALDAACAELGDTNRAELVREVFARRIIAAARIGERDPVRLREAALTEPGGERS